MHTSEVHFSYLACSFQFESQKCLITLEFLKQECPLMPKIIFLGILFIFFIVSYIMFSEKD